MDADLYPIDELAADREFVCKKLGLSVEELEALLHAPRRSYSDYPSNEALLARLRRLRARWRARPYQPATKKRDQKAQAEENAA